MDKPIPILTKGRLNVNEVQFGVGEGSLRSECSYVMYEIEVQDLPHSKEGRLKLVSNLRKDLFYDE